MRSKDVHVDADQQRPTKHPERHSETTHSPSGDALEFVIDEDGRVLVLPASIDASGSSEDAHAACSDGEVEDMIRAIRKRGGPPMVGLGTERSETITIGTNELIGTDPGKLPHALARLMAGQWKKGAIPPKWDGKAAERIVEHLERLLASKSNNFSKTDV